LLWSKRKLIGPYRIWVQSVITHSFTDNWFCLQITNNPNVTPLEIKNAYLYASLERLCEGYNINTEREPTFIKITEKYSKDTFKIKLHYNLVTKAELERIYDDNEDEDQYFYSSNFDKTPNVIKLDNGDVLIPVGTDETDATIVERIVKITEKKTKHYSFNSYGILN